LGGDWTKPATVLGVLQGEPARGSRGSIDEMTGYSRLTLSR